MERPEWTVHALFSHLKQPVALKKTSGSTTSRDMLLLPSHQPEKGMMTRSVRTGRASATSSSFSSSVEDRFQRSPGHRHGQLNMAGSENLRSTGPTLSLGSCKWLPSR